MMRTIRHRKRTRRSLLSLIALARVFACCSSGIAEETSAGPTIARVEVGFKNYYKLGFWTPVLVDVSGAAGGDARDLRVSVTASDSDGVPTTASVAVPTATDRSEHRTATVYTQIGRIAGSV